MKLLETYLYNNYSSTFNLEITLEIAEIIAVGSKNKLFGFQETSEYYYFRDFMFRCYCTLDKEENKDERTKKAMANLRNALFFDFI